MIAFNKSPRINVLYDMIVAESVIVVSIVKTPHMISGPIAPRMLTHSKSIVDLRESCVCHGST